jgi:2',3'-cyclic-nucleotide 2'-phosphodiesterase (5'-nucleotidase family)
MTPEPFHLTILHTNDMHSHLEAMARLSAFAKILRRQLESEGRRVLFFDAGDAADRRVQFTGVTKGKAFPRVLAAMGYDLQTLGNAISVTYGPQAAGEIAQRSEFPVLAAQFFDGDTQLVEGFRPYALFPLYERVKLGVIGLTVHIPQLYQLFGLRTPHFLEAARRWVGVATAEGARPLVILSHLGLREDAELAESVPGIDLIIGGHSHSELHQGQMTNGVLIAQAGDYARLLGRVDLELDAQTGEVLAKSAALLPVPEDTPPDPAFEQAVRDAEAEAVRELSRPIALLQEELELDHFGECAVANLGADAVRERMGAEVGLLISGLFHRGLPAGTVTLGDLNACSFSTANPQLSRVRGEQILAALERGLDPDHMHEYIKAHRGAPTGWPAVSGMVVEYDPGANPRVRRVLVNGVPLEPQRLYTVGHTDAEVIQGDYLGGLLILEENQVVRVEVPTILREAIEDYLAAHQPVKKPAGGRWVRM